MKLIITILRDIDNDSVSEALLSKGYRITQIASTGGFFRRGSTTLLIGVDDDIVERAIEIIRTNLNPTPAEPGTHRANLFVIDVESFQQI